MPGKTVALLDVDDTLIPAFIKTESFNSGRINTNLIHTLLEQDITDVYLFTDMLLEQLVVKHREDLIDWLKSFGFTVHGVITPADVFWNNIPELTATKPEIRAVYKHNELGAAFKYAQEEKQITNQISKKTFQQSYNSGRNFISKLNATTMHYPHIKGIMLEFFIAKLPDWVKSIVVLDDKPLVIMSVLQVGYSYELSTPPIDAIRVDTLDMPVERYSSALNIHRSKAELSSLNTFMLLHDIQQEISRLQSSQFLINKSARDKIAALNTLKERIENETNPTRISQLIGHWELEHNSIISTNRNPLRTIQTQTHITSTQRFVSRVKHLYGGTLRTTGNSEIETRHDIKLILKEICRLRRDRTSWFNQGKQIKAIGIEQALVQAITNHCTDVTHNSRVKDSLAKPRLFSFFGLRKAAALVNVTEETAKLNVTT